MLKLALIGRDIAHSKSESVYKKLLDYPFQYKLLDYKDSYDIPAAVDLLKTYDGISITSPYKTHFLSEIKDLSGFGIVNTLRKSQKEVIEGTNTDSLAIEFILERYINSGVDNIKILGDGSMSNVCQRILKKRQVDFRVFSRRLGNLQAVLENPSKPDFSTLIINTCARDFRFNNSGSSHYHFWDMNYNMNHHQELFKSIDIAYSDGIEQLELQAKYALSFWNLNKTQPNPM